MRDCLDLPRTPPAPCLGLGEPSPHRMPSTALPPVWATCQGARFPGTDPYCGQRAPPAEETEECHLPLKPQGHGRLSGLLWPQDKGGQLLASRWPLPPPTVTQPVAETCLQPLQPWSPHPHPSGVSVPESEADSAGSEGPRGSDWPGSDDTPSQPRGGGEGGDWRR